MKKPKIIALTPKLTLIVPQLYSDSNLSPHFWTYHHCFYFEWGLRLLISEDTTFCWSDFNLMLKMASIELFLLLSAETAFLILPLLFLHILYLSSSGTKNSIFTMLVSRSYYKIIVFFIRIAAFRKSN